MTSSIHIDCRRIACAADFYDQFIAESPIQGEFGYNLDALWDSLTGGMALPATIYIDHFSVHHDKAVMTGIIALIMEAAAVLDGQLSVLINGKTSLSPWCAEATRHLK